MIPSVGTEGIAVSQKVDIVIVLVVVGSCPRTMNADGQFVVGIVALDVVVLGVTGRTDSGPHLAPYAFCPGSAIVAVHLGHKQRTEALVAEFLNLEPQRIGNLLVFVGTEHIATDGELVGAGHIERTTDGALLAVVSVTLGNFGAELGCLAGLHLVGGCGDALHFGHTAGLFLGDENHVAVHVDAVGGGNFHIVASGFGERGGKGKGLLHAGHLLTAHVIKNADVGSLMVGVFETDCEGFVGLDDGLVEGDVVNDGEGTLEFLAPCDVALGLSVATYRADTNLIGILTSGEGSFHYVVCPRGGGGHEGLHIALAEPDFVIPGSDFLVIDGTAFVLCRAGAGEGKIEDHLEVGTVIVALHHLGVGDDGLYGYLVEVGRNITHLTEEGAVVRRGVGKGKSYTGHHITGCQTEF